MIYKLRQMLLALCFLPMTALAAEPEDDKASLLWGYWFSLSEVWQMHDPEEEPRLLIDNSNYPVEASPVFYLEERDELVSSLLKFGTETLVIDMPHNRNHYTAGINFGDHQSLQTGVGITRFWLGSAQSERQEHEYISLILRYAY
ncbi:MAG: hypothetical protein R3352_02485 [Salinisphaeraceae bacterium]|nr:hypothetical protein [Salinisphaeraceae bacterium]